EVELAAEDQARGGPVGRPPDLEEVLGRGWPPEAPRPEPLHRIRPRVHHAIPVTGGRDRRIAGWPGQAVLAPCPEVTGRGRMTARATRAFPEFRAGSRAVSPGATPPTPRHTGCPPGRPRPPPR